MATQGAFRPLIFISHSARNDADAYANLTIIKNHLVENGFDVLIDETRITGGEDWRECINTWLAYCHGAIILLTEKALKSDWVQREATIAAFRRSRTPGSEFKLLPVLLGISANDMTNSQKFGVIELADYQALMNLKDLPLAKKLAELLEPLRSLQPTTPRQLAENKLAGLLLAPSVKPDLLNVVIARLGVDTGGWRPDKDLASRTAMALLQAPLQRIVDTDALQPLDVLTEQAMDQVVGMLRASWIDVMTAAKFVEVSTRPEGTRAAALNGNEKDFTERSLFARANGGDLDWKFIELSDRSGEDLGGSFLKQARAEIKKVTRAKDQAGMLKAIQTYTKTKPFLIVLPPIDENAPLPDEAEIDRLLQEYPLCTFFVLSGPTALAPDCLKKFVRLEPPLGADDESNAFSNFNVLRMQTGKAWN
jgi:TIR domain